MEKQYRGKNLFSMEGDFNFIVVVAIQFIIILSKQ